MSSSQKLLVTFSLVAVLVIQAKAFQTREARRASPASSSFDSPRGLAPSWLDSDEEREPMGQVSGLAVPADPSP